MARSVRRRRTAPGRTTCALGDAGEGGGENGLRSETKLHSEGRGKREKSVQPPVREDARFLDYDPRGLELQAPGLRPQGRQNVVFLLRALMIQKAFSPSTFNRRGSQVIGKWRFHGRLAALVLKPGYLERRPAPSLNRAAQARHPLPLTFTAYI